MKLGSTDRFFKVAAVNGLLLAAFSLNAQQPQEKKAAPAKSEIKQGAAKPAAEAPASAADDAGSKAAPRPAAFRTFNTYTPGPCSPNGQADGGCPKGKLVRIRVVTVASGLLHPWQIAFLPGSSDILVTESVGRLRVIRDGKLDSHIVPGWPITSFKPRALFSVVAHPKFEQNHYVYLTYSKGRLDQALSELATPPEETTLALARGKFENGVLTDVHDLFIADAWSSGGALAGKAAFGPDGMLYLSVGDRDRTALTDDNRARMAAQRLDNHIGKVLRLTDEGTAPTDNPFVNMDAKPEIYTYGHRNVEGLAWHPDTGELWATEIGPMGGDELNILKPGKNYGWPLVSLGKIYTGHGVSDQSWWRPDVEMPVMFWMPAISPAGLTFYTGDKFPLWKGHLFSGALSGQQLQRIAFNQPPPQSERRESMLTQMGIRIRDVRQSPDGYLYLATEVPTERTPAMGRRDIPDPPNGRILRIEPAP